MKFTRKTIGIIHSQQPANQYAGGGSGINDSEQHWMRELAKQVAEQLETTGHEVLLGPTGDRNSTFRDNVRWANSKNLDLLISLHSNATGRAGTRATGITCYWVSSAGRKIAAALAKRLKPVSATGKTGTSNSLRVSELVNTKAPAVLVENEYHDWAGSVTAGGAVWLRDPSNRANLAKGYRAAIVDLYGEKTTAAKDITPQIKTTATTYTVVQSDTLYSIAKKLLGDGSRYLEISEASGITGTLIYPGQKLTIPTN